VEEIMSALKNGDPTPTARSSSDPKIEGPAPADEGNYALQDWDSIVTGTLVPISVDPNDLDQERDSGGDELLEEDNDNLYQNSDEALPEDSEEAALRRNPSKEGGLFDEV
jgi:hypothetical protein